MRHDSVDAPRDDLDFIADYVQQLEYRYLPAQVIQRAKTLLLEGISWMVMGARKEEAQKLLSVVGKDGAQGCNIIGTKQRAEFLDAVLVNTALAQVHDCSDTRRLARRDGGSNHPGRCAIPVALSLGQYCNLSGAALVELLVLGYEVASRVKATDAYLEYSYAAAAMTARAMKLSRDATRRALALAHFSLPMTTQGPDGMDFDFLKYGFVAKAAVGSVAYAGEEFLLPFHRCTITLGTFHEMHDPAPSAYALNHVSIKPYPCCRSLHGAIDLALDLCASREFDPTVIASVEVRVGNSKERLFQPVASDAYYKHCQFSIPYVVAGAFLDGEISENSFTKQRIARQDIQQLQEKIHCISDVKLRFKPNGRASVFRPTMMKVTTTGGKHYSRGTVSPKGSPLNPLSREELIAKFNVWTGPTFSPSQKAKIVRMVDEIERIPDVAQLLSLLEA